MNTTKIKICGLFRLCDADFVNQAMPDYAGFVFFEKSHRFVTEEQGKKLRENINNEISTVGVFVNHDFKYIKKLYEKKIISIIQLHGDEDEAYISALRNMLPKAEIWKAFTVRSSDDVLKAKNCIADRVLLDNGYGTGKCFEWSVVDNFGRQIILAGGLNADNIRPAITRFHPFAVDVSSGVECNKVKNRDKIMATVAAVKACPHI